VSARILLAGGSGVIGSRLIPALVAAGHDVVATTRREENLPRLRALGARGVVADAYDAQRLATVTADAAPDVVVHQLTDLAAYDVDANARLRREGTANLVAATRAAGCDRMIVQSIAWVFPPGRTPATEEDPIVPGTAVDDMENLVRGLPHATVLRYGMLYGPGTWYEPGGRIARAVTAGEVPSAPAITPFVHVDDAVTATVQSLGWPDGTYHVVDDEPAPTSAWLPVLAAALGVAAPPVPGPDPAGRLVSNAKARAQGWTPAHPRWRDGFATLHGQLRLS
jgi:nucleoside-diphosphate-sugar epimerase